MTEIPIDSVLISAALIAVLLEIIVMYRVAIGPTMQDRVIGINVMGTSTIIIIAFLSAGLGKPEFIDIAIVYGLLNFVLSVAIAKFTIDRGEVL